MQNVYRIACEWRLLPHEAMVMIPSVMSTDVMIRRQPSLTQNDDAEQSAEYRADFTDRCDVRKRRKPHGEQE